MEPRSRKILGAVIAAGLALVLLLLAGWSIYDALFRRDALVVTLPTSATSSDAQPDKQGRDINNIKPVFVQVAYMPGMFQQTEVMAALRKQDDASKAIWLKVEEEQQRKRFGYVTSMSTDPRGYIWAGCEDSGVWRYDPPTPDSERWKRYGTEDGLGDNHVYAVAVDRQSRVWVGHLNHGVSVGNGAQWQNYEPVAGISKEGSLAGPLGERVFAIAVCPTDGDVWIATNAGLTRYSDARDTWSYYTRGDGLPFDQAAAIAFDRQGNIFVGTQCEGIAMASAADDYKTWRVTRGPDQPPLDPAGDGLPSNLINDLLVARDGIVYAATCAGVAFSKDSGQTWQYIRGKNWAERVSGLYGGPPAGWAPKEGFLLEHEDITALSEDEQGLWVVNRKNGCDLIDLQAGEVFNSKLRGWTVRRVVGTPTGQLAGTYGDGREQPRQGVKPTVASGKPAPLPSGAKPPTDAEIAQMIARCKAASSASINAPLVVPLDDDWRTQGEWLGRYGRYWACLSAMATRDYLWGTAPPGAVRYYAGVSRNRPDHYLRHSVPALHTSDSRALEMPSVYLHSRVESGQTTWEINRRLAEWNDGAHQKYVDKEGPDIYCNLTVPPGLFYLSLYDVNKDGRKDDNRYRDYLVSIRASASPTNLASFDGFDQQPELARSRIKNFWFGCYKRFLVKGPATLTIRVGRNYSYNTLLAAVMLDSIDPFPQSYFAGRIPSPTAPSTPADELADLAEQTLRADPQSAAWLHAVHVKLLRWYRAHSTSPALASALRPLNSMYRLHYFEPWEATQQKLGVLTARQIERSLRWDRKTENCSGMESMILSQWLASHPSPAPAAQ